MLPSLFPLSVLTSRLARPPDQVLIDSQPFQPDGPATVNLVGTDAHLGAKAIAHPVRHTRAGVPIHAGGIHAGHERLGGALGRGEDGVGVVGGVRVDVRDGEVDGVGHGGDSLDGED